MTPKVALVAGASGVVGRTLVGHLAAQSDWDVIAVSRQAPDIPGRWRHLSLDLLDAAACAAATAELARVTHVFHCAFVLDPDPEAHIRRNLALLVNLVQTVERAGAPIEHVHLVGHQPEDGKPADHPTRRGDLFAEEHGGPVLGQLLLHHFGRPGVAERLVLDGHDGRQVGERHLANAERHRGHGPAGLGENGPRSRTSTCLR